MQEFYSLPTKRQFLLIMICNCHSVLRYLVLSLLLCTASPMDLGRQHISDLVMIPGNIQRLNCEYFFFAVNVTCICQCVMAIVFLLFEYDTNVLLSC